MQDFSRYHKAVAYLEGLSNIPVKHDYMSARGGSVLGRHDPTIYIKRMRWFLGLLGNPERDFKYIHITGTAGKGTVSTMVQSMLVKAGHKTGLFTSPFVTTSIEKIQVDDLYIDPLEFADIVEELKPMIDRAYAECPWGGPSYFERFLAIALVYFKRQKCEWVVLEVGCGGRYDATNVIPPPVVSAITNIDYDHMHILGKTLTKITRDKAGIIKKGSVFFTSEPRLQLRRIMEDIAHEQGADYRYVKGGNTELVSAIIKSLRIPGDAIEVHLPARFEKMQDMPLVIVDGAHNRAKMRFTAEHLKKLSYKKLHLVIALAANKQRHEILEAIIPLAYAVYPTRFQHAGRQSANPADLLPGKRGYSDPHQALDAALAAAGPKDVVLVTGSFYLAGELRVRWQPESEILANRKSF